jgi:uncharacterized protein involved in response to NO
LWLAPHRLAFFAGTLMLLLSAGAWLVSMSAPYAGTVVTTLLPPTLMHGVLFAGGFMPLFIAGFMYTAGPRWLDVPTPPASALSWPVLLHCAGVVLLVAGALAGYAVTAFGALLLAIAWTAVGLGFASMLKASHSRDRLHARCIMAFWMSGVAAALLFAAAIATHQLAVAGVGLWLMLFAFVVPITVTVAHRVLPFFTSSAVSGIVPWRPHGVLALLLAGVLAFAASQLVTRFDPLAGTSVAWLTLITVAPAACALVALAVRWALVQNLRGRSLRLVAMLHLAFLWVPMALLLATIDAVLFLAWGNGGPRLGVLPLHALTMGFLGSMLFAMATRVISGHGGLAVTVDGVAWLLFWLLQLDALLRLSIPVLPGAAGALSAVTALLWAVIWGAWAARYLPILLRPRADGRPG